MKFNPFNAIEKLIVEHGSSVIQSKHIALLQEELAIIKEKFSALTTEIETLNSQNQQLAQENEILWKKVKKYEQPHDASFNKEKIKILLLLHNGKGGLFTFQIAQNLKLSEDIVKYHLQELRKTRLIREGLPTLPGQHSWNIEDKGTKYLIENKLIS